MFWDDLQLLNSTSGVQGIPTLRESRFVFPMTSLKVLSELEAPASTRGIKPLLVGLSLQIEPCLALVLVASCYFLLKSNKSSFLFLCIGRAVLSMKTLQSILEFVGIP